MITKSEWQAVNHSMMAEGRRREEPPTSEEMLSFTRGELSPEEEARIRERLVCYPELVRTLTAPFPIEGAEPGDPDYLSDEELARHWASLQGRTRRGRVVRFPHAWTALAAGLAIVFAALFWYAESRARRLAAELAQPRATDSQILMPDGRRGGGEPATPLTATGEWYSLLLPIVGDAELTTFRLEIVDPAAVPRRTLWRSSVLPRPASETFAISIPRSFFKPGDYAIVLYGLSGAREEPLASYALRVAAR